MDLDAAIDRVYGAAPEDFMSVRTSLATEARQAKDRDLAKAIGALRKPTRSAWMINLLARQAADEVGGLLDLGAALREAQQNLSGPELRRLSGERQKAVAALAKRAGALAAENGHKSTDAQLQEVTQHLQAALADPELAEDVRTGRVTQIITFGGFGPWEAGGTASTTAGTSAATKPAAKAPPQEDVEAAGPSAEELQLARDRWKQTRADVHDAESAAEQATGRADAAADAVRKLRTELADAERAAEKAENERTKAEQRLAGARAEAETAETALEELLDG